MARWSVTIAACYLSPEGLVLGADSTTTYGNVSGNHYFNHAQKLFEIGNGSSLGVVTWGLGGLHVSSYRTLLALLDDDFRANPPVSVADVADRWANQFWAAYSASPIMQNVGPVLRALDARPPFDATGAAPAPNARTQQEEEQYQGLKTVLVVGFFIGGYVLPDRTPIAFEIVVEPLSAAAPTPVPVNSSWQFRGAPNMIQRLLFGYDDAIVNSILGSGHWNGTPADLNNVLQGYRLEHPVVPIRDAIDFINACIASTIKSFKFSNLSQICGGPIEIAVITSDRAFRWVKHKDWDSALAEGAA